jgi:hypothetical protein
MMGPIELALMGFGIGFPLRFNLNDLGKLSIHDFDVKLSGLGVSFDKPPVLIAGFFENDSDDTKEAYRGGLAVSIPPYALLAVGAYQHTFANNMRSVFVFASLDGPLFTLEFAEISGVEAGFGYNYDLRLPGPGDVYNFPLVHGEKATTDPMELMSAHNDSPKNFNKWITPTADRLWFAIGAKVDAFEVLTVDAAICVLFGASSFKIAIAAMASASMPPAKSGGGGSVTFCYVELALAASLDITGGSLIVSGQLTPNSYILAPDCHLTGGFALCYWFPPNGHAGGKFNPLKILRIEGY